MTTQPQVIRDEMSLKSAEVGVDIARGAMLPSLVLFGGLDTRWSSAGFRNVGEEQLTISQNVEIEQVPVTITQTITRDIFEDAPYFNQLKTNFGQQIGLSLNVPIYNNHSNLIGVERAKLNILTSKLQSDLTKQQLKTDVQNALASARAAHRTLKAANKSVEAAEAAFENAEKQYELGAINTFQYTTARNNLDRAEIDATVAKYDYLFRLKIIDFYLGKEIKLK